MEQKFVKGDIVTDGDFRMVVVNVFTDPDEERVWCHCKAVDFDIPHIREIPQEHLKKYEEETERSNNNMIRYKLTGYYENGTEGFGTFNTKEEALEEATALLQRIESIEEFEITMVITR